MNFFKSKTANPAFSEKVLSTAVSAAGGEKMTIDGAINKSGILLAIVVVTGYLSWTKFLSGGDPAAQMMTGKMFLIGGSIGAFLIALLTIFKPNLSPITAPIYAVFEGILLGAISAVFEFLYPGIIFQAILATAATFVGMLLAYKTGALRATAGFRKWVTIATLGIAIVYFVNFVAGFFGANIPGLFGAGLVGIGFSLFVIAIAALNLILDFDFIEKSAAAGAPKFFEWYGAFGLLVTIIWLYIEILRLLSKLRDR